MIYSNKLQLNNVSHLNFDDNQIQDGFNLVPNAKWMRRHY